MTQTEMIADHLKKYGKISDLTAFGKYGIRRLSARIYDLRAGGLKIRSENTKSKNRYGKTIRYATYILDREKKEI